MGRLAPDIILTSTDNRTHDTIEILAADFIWAVFYDGKPINIRVSNHEAMYSQKYRRVSFANAGHAFNIAERMNRLFKTDKFRVHQLTDGPEVYEHDYRRLLDVMTMARHLDVE